MSGRLYIALLLVSCAVLPDEQRPVVITVIYDPAAANLPTPNDLAMTEGKVAIAPNPLVSDAENLLKAGFNGKNGFSSASTPRAQFSGALSAASITKDTAVAFDVTQAATTPVDVARTYADCDHSLTFSSATGFTPGHTYLFAVTNGLKGAQGEEVAPAPAFYFLRAGKNLEEHPDAVPGDTRADRAATAKKLEAVRQQLEPYFQKLEAAGIARRTVAALWSFTVYTDPEAFFDPSSQQIPFPNDLLIDPKTGLVALPAQAGDNADTQAVKATLNQLDGFSTTAALYVSTTTPIDRTTVSASTVKLFEAKSGAEFTDIDRTLGRDGKKIVIQPRTPLMPATAYVVSIAGVKDTTGSLYAAMPLAQVLALKLPLTDAEGHSQLSNLCDDTAKRLDPIRADVSPRAVGSSAAWRFTTLDIARHATDLWKTPYDQNLPLQAFDVQSQAGPITMPSVAKIITGRMMTFDRLDPTTHAFSSGPGTQRKIDFVLTLPKTTASKVKIVVFGHGLYTARTLGIMVADRLARSGFATLSIDLPLHGERTVCTQDSHCTLGAHCAPDGVCIGSDGKPADFARLPPLPGAPGPGVPTATGQAWVDVEHLGATRDHFRQAIIDLSAEVRLVREMDWTTVTQGPGLDPEQMHYVGISLGGIIGADEAGLEPHYQSLLLNVAGAGLVDLLNESATFSVVLTAGLSAKGITQGTDAYDTFINAARWVLDEIDPINIAPFARKRPLNGAAPKKLRLQEAILDAVVPNASTERLITAIGIDRNTEFRSFIGTHAFLADPAEASCYVAQDDMASFLEAN